MKRQITEARPVMGNITLDGDNVVDRANRWNIRLKNVLPHNKEGLPEINVALRLWKTKHTDSISVLITFYDLGLALGMLNKDREIYRSYCCPLR
jgi:hypothetical protein